VDFRLSTQGRNQIFFRSIFYEKQARDEFQKSRTSNRGLHDVGGPPIRVLGYDPREHWSCGTRTPHTQHNPFRKLLSFLKILNYISSHPSLWIHSFIQLASIHTSLLQRFNQRNIFNYPQIPYPISRVAYNPPHTSLHKGLLRNRPWSRPRHLPKRLKPRSRRWTPPIIIRPD
jgi:hypothetical protein